MALKSLIPGSCRKKSGKSFANQEFGCTFAPLFDSVGSK
jgi:hypothetical protein